MGKFGLKPNIDFINILIKRRLSRKDYFEASEAFQMIQKYQLTPNIMTFGCLAKRVNSLDLLIQFLNDLKVNNL